MIVLVKEHLVILALAQKGIIEEWSIPDVPIQEHLRHLVCEVLDIPQEEKDLLEDEIHLPENIAKKGICLNQGCRKIFIPKNKTPNQNINLYLRHFLF